MTYKMNDQTIDLDSITGITQNKKKVVITFDGHRRLVLSHKGVAAAKQAYAELCRVKGIHDAQKRI